MTIRKLTPQPFPNDIEETAKNNLLTKQNQELQTNLDALKDALPKAGLVTFDIKTPLTVLPLQVGDKRPFGFGRFQCKKDDTVVYNGILYITMHPGTGAALNWSEEKPSSRLLEWNQSQLAYNSGIYRFDTCVPFSRYFIAPVDNPICGFDIICVGANINYVLLSAYYQVFR